MAGHACHAGQIGAGMPLLCWPSDLGDERLRDNPPGSRARVAPHAQWIADRTGRDRREQPASLVALLAQPDPPVEDDDPRAARLPVLQSPPDAAGGVAVP